MFSTARAAEVKVARVPDGGLQPQVVVEAMKTVHLVYLTGDPKSAEVIYRRSTDGGATWLEALRVSTPQTRGIAAGAVRGPDLAVSANGTVHVMWMSSPKLMSYARLAAGEKKFEIPRNLIGSHPGLDGGGSIAADDKGHVYAAWHAPESKDGGEESRRVYLAVSADDGATFAPERAVFDKPTGACACCGMRMTVAADGTPFIAYRSAHEKINRGLYLIYSADHGQTFRGGEIAPMKLGTCLMSTASFARYNNEMLAAWETNGSVSWGKVYAVAGEVGVEKPYDVGKGTNQKHPCLAITPDGDQVLCAWTEQTSFGKGGQMVWQAYDSSGRPTRGQRDDLPANSFPAAFCTGNDSFTILY